MMQSQTSSLIFSASYTKPWNNLDWQSSGNAMVRGRASEEVYIPARTKQGLDFLCRFVEW
jgi:hypothetical protein